MFLFTRLSLYFYFFCSLPFIVLVFILKPKSFPFTFYVAPMAFSSQNVSLLPPSSTSIVELDEHLFALVLYLKEESKKAQETQVLIPYIIGDVTYAFRTYPLIPLIPYTWIYLKMQVRSTV